MNEANAPPGQRRLLIVDDHPITRQGLTALIDLEPDLQVCGEAKNAAEALSAVEELKPDLVLADITLPGRNGLELIKDLQAIRPELPILVISMHDEALYAERVLKAGGRGYIMKQEGGSRIINAVRQVLDGRVYVSEAISEQILAGLSGRGGRGSSGFAVERLTDREFEVFQLIGNGMSTREIAERLNISSKTVDVHRVNMKQKLNIRSASELIRFAVRWVETSSVRDSETP